MLLIIISVSAYYIASEISGAGRTDEEHSTLTEENQKNYLSPISVNNLLIDKTEPFVDTAALLKMGLGTESAGGMKNTLQKVTAGIHGIHSGIAESINSIGNLVGPAIKSQLAAKAYAAAVETRALTMENYEAYVEENYQRELEGTIHHLFDCIFVTNDSKIEDYLNIREVPDGNIVGRMYPGTGGTFLDIQNGWALINSGEVTGWVSLEYILTGTQVLQSGAQLSVVVDAERLMLRDEADTNSALVEVLEQGTEASYLDYTAGWVRVSYNEYLGYLKAEYVHLKAGANTAVPMSEELWNETLADAGLLQQEAAEIPAADSAVLEAPAAEAPAPEVQAAGEAPAEEAAPVVTEPTADELARQRIDAIYGEGRSTMAPIYLSADDIYLLACVIMMEAGNECYEGKLAVAGVVMNRLRNGYWGSTLREVIYSPRQFTGAGTGLLDQFLASGPSEECIRAAYEACAGIHNIGSYLYFCSVKSAQYDQYSAYLVIQRQCFYAK